MQLDTAISISNNLSLPLVGLGTWRLKGAQCIQTVQTALEIGYRHIDTAHIYENHKEIGEAIEGWERSQLFLTSKFTLAQLKNHEPETFCDQALQDLKTDYLDLYLLHFPDRSLDIIGLMKKSLGLLEQGKIRSLGVSNCTQRHLQDLLDHQIPIVVNQVEFHPYLNQQDLLKFCQKRQIHLMAYRSLGKGVLLTDPVFIEIGNKYGKTPSQIILRWILEQGISVIPKATSRKQLEENFDLFDFTLTLEDKTLLDQLNTQHRFCAGEWTDFNYL